ncbi:hypothetical protein Tco_1562617 [Tanacetum coccineum]
MHLHSLHAPAFLIPADVPESDICINTGIAYTSKNDFYQIKMIKETIQAYLGILQRYLSDLPKSTVVTLMLFLLKKTLNLLKRISVILGLSIHS